MKNIIFIVFISFMACSSPGQKKDRTKSRGMELKPGVVYDSLKCKNDPAIGYSLYLPKEYVGSEKSSPVIFFFDAHKRGTLPLKKYKDLADRYGVIFVGSNSSENGQQHSLSSRIVSSTINDVKKRFNIDEMNIYTAGFSGGARVAVRAALSGDHLISGVIGCAAGFPNVQSLTGMNFRWVGVVGNKDFNYLELVNVNRQLKASGHDSHLLVYEGKHEWPPVEVFDKALDILFGGKTDEFTDDPAIRRLENEEFKERQFLADAIQSKDLTWWNEKIRALENSSQKAPAEAERLMNARLLSFMSMVSFMYANSAIKQDQREAAKKYLAIYEKVDPENPDVYFLKAEYFIQLKKPDEAMQMLKKSAGLGYANYENLMNNSLLNQLHDNPDFKDISKKVFNNKGKE